MLEGSSGMSEASIRKIFEKHSMEKNPDLELFDTDAIITEIAQHVESEKASAVKDHWQRSSTNGRPLSAPPLIIDHPIPCNDCGSTEWYDWTIWPHQVFNYICPKGGYLCLPCFSKRVLRVT